MPKAIKTPVDFLKALRDAEITWIATGGDPTLFDAVFEGEHVQIRLNEFPEAPIYTVFFRSEEFDLEEGPKTWQLQH